MENSTIKSNIALIKLLILNVSVIQECNVAIENKTTIIADASIDTLIGWVSQLRISNNAVMKDDAARIKNKLSILKVPIMKTPSGINLSEISANSMFRIK